MKCSIEKRFFALMLAVMLIITFALTGCSPNGDDSSMDTSSSGTLSSDAAPGNDVPSDADSSDTMDSQATTADSNNAPSVNVPTTSERDITTPTQPETSLTLNQVMSKIPSKLKGKTIKYFMWYDGRAETEGAAISAFEQKTGIKVDVQLGSYGNFTTELASKIAADNAPDLIRLLSPAVSQVKVLQPLNKLNFNFNDKAWDKTTMQDYTFNGNSYATNLKNTVYFDAFAMFYSTKVFEDNDLEDPYELWKQGKWTWGKFDEICQEFVDNGSGTYGGGASDQSYLISTFGVGLIHYDGKKYVNSIANPALNSKLVTAYSNLLDKVNKGLLTPKTNMITDFEVGKSCFFAASISYGLSKRANFGKYKAQGSLRAVPLPQGTNDYTTMNEYSAWGVPIGAKNGEAVPYFLRYMLDMDVYDANKMFSHKSILESFEFIRASKKRISNPAKNMITSADNGIDFLSITARILNNEKSQISSILQSFSGNVQDAVDKANQQLAQMK